MNNMPYPYFPGPFPNNQNTKYNIDEELYNLKIEISKLKERIAKLENKNSHDYLKKDDSLNML